MDEAHSDRQQAGNVRRHGIAISSLVGLCAAGLLLAAPARAQQAIGTNTLASLRLAIQDLAQRYAAPFNSLSPAYLLRLDTIESAYITAVGAGDTAGIQAANASYQALKREALVTNNPALAFGRVLYVKRNRLGSGDNNASWGLPNNWKNVSTAVNRTNFYDSLCLLNVTNGTVTELYRPATNFFLAFPNVHWNADRVLFTSVYLTNNARCLGVFEIGMDGTGLQRVSPFAGTDVDWFDACYLPNGDIIMASTAPFAGVPCVTGSDYVGNLFRLTRSSGVVRQLTFDQDQNWGPTILEDGRVMFTRWEYSDTPHYFSRILFTMMPDGLEQFARYGSGSYWPNGLLDARPVPGKPSQFVAVISGHHGVAREGELILFDDSKGMTEADGVVHRFCGPNPVQPVVIDRLIDTLNPWPRFVQPFPVDEKQVLVSARLASTNIYGIYLVDLFDNLTELRYQPGVSLMHPTPVRAVPAPPIVPDRVKPTQNYGVVNLSDVYFGPGLRGVPRGKIKQLRVYAYHYAYRQQGGHVHVAVDGGWDVHRILGTVPVYADGSASFYAPANTPIAVQPLDDAGKAVQLFRSWYTVMPGESVSCAGCHERRNEAMINQTSIASRKEPDPITPWNGPERGFNFLREVQPVLDQYCSGCHGAAGGTTNAAPDLWTTNRVAPNSYGFTTGNTFPKSYVNLHPYVRRPGNEGYFRINNPGEWHADNSELVQLLQKGHYGVQLESNAWDRLVTWIDLNVPCWGAWSEWKAVGGNPNYHDRRLQMMSNYANVTIDPEVYPTSMPARGTFIPPVPAPAKADQQLTATGWPFSVSEAQQRRQAAAAANGVPEEITLNLGGGRTLVLDLIPSGQFVMGSRTGYDDEYPQSVVTIDQPYYMAKFEISNEQFALFDTNHQSGFVAVFGKDHNAEGWTCNDATQPALRVSWQEALQFCEWLTKLTGRKFTLPTEAQWEYACRAGTTNDMWYGPTSTVWTNRAQLLTNSFYRAGPVANLAGFEYYNNPIAGQLLGSPRWFLANTNVTDPWVATTNPAAFASNPFGLCALHGNAAEWTLSTYAPYPYDDLDGRNRALFDTNEWLTVRKVVRGGSMMDRQRRATSSFRTAMPPWERGYNVGFRVVAGISTNAPSLPTAAFEASTTNGTADLTADFDARASSDPDGRIVEYRWDFGDGTIAGGAIADHVFTVPGTYAVTLTVTDSDGFTATKTTSITVNPRTGGGAFPIASFTATPGTGAAPCTVTFNASASSDPDGNVALYYWDFGDGTLGSGQTANHLYSAGRYTVALTVIDNSGLRDTKTGEVVVTGAGGNRAPVVEAGLDALAIVTNAVALNGVVSDDALPDPPGSLSVAWTKVKGPGTVAFADATAANTTANFSAQGTYVLALTASDGELSARDTVTLTVLAQSPYRSPCELAYSPDGTLLAVGDLTARALVLINPTNGQVLRTINLPGEPRDLAWRATNSLFVAEHGAGTVAEIVPQTGAVLRRIKTGPKPAGLAIAPGKELLLVADRGLDKLSVFDLATGTSRAEIPVVREPHFVTVTPDGHFAIVANHLPAGDARDTNHAAALSFVNLDNLREVDNVRLPPGSTIVQHVICSPDGRWAYVTHTLGRSSLPTTQLSRGWVITSALSIIALTNKQVYSTVLFDQNDDGAADPWGLALSADGNTLWAALSGVREVARLDLGRLHALLRTNAVLRAGMSADLTTLSTSGLLQRMALPGEGPRGIALSPDERTLAVAAYFAGAVYLVNSSNGVVGGEIGVGAQPAENSLRRGERLYFDANGCFQRWVSCNSCHPGTRADGMNWDMMNDGFGNAKNTKSHLYAPQTPPSMWTGIRADAMVGIQAGYKFIEFQAHSNDDYNDIYNFLGALEPEPSPFWVDGRLTPDAVLGKAIFESAEANCLSCHRPEYYLADSNKTVVGTQHAGDWTANDATGYIAPTLYELWRTGPYLHDGSAETLREVLTTCNPADQHGKTSHLTRNQINQLAAYLLQIGGDAPASLGPTNTLTVNNGDGSGNYPAGCIVTVSANPPPAGKAFSHWTGAQVDDPGSATTTLTMPDSDVSVTATYQDASPGSHKLTVNHGTGSGRYPADTAVPVEADPPWGWDIFDQWDGDVNSMTNVRAASTSVAMPPSNITVTAVYKAKPALPFIHSAGGASGISSNAATLNGYLHSTGGAPTTVWFYWGPADGGTNPANWPGSFCFGPCSVGALTTNLVGLQQNTTYFYRPYATNAAGEFWASPSAQFSTVLILVPSGLTATPGSGQVTLAWAATPGAASYNLKRANSSGGPYTTVAAELTATNYTDTTVGGCGTYYYRVSGVGVGGESPDSSAVIAVLPSPLPSPLQHQDIGPVGVAGNGVFCSGTFTVLGSGVDIWGTGDSFHFVYLPMAGDGTITVRVATQQTNLNVWSKSGVMIRETTDSGSKHVGLYVTPGNGVSMQYRSTNSAASVDLARAGGLVAPYWVRLVRSGNTFTGYRSPDGITWLQVSSISNSLASAALAGLAVSSHSNAALNLTTFDNLTAPGGVATPPSPPSWLVAVAGTNRVLLTWCASAGVTNYNVKRSLTSGGPYTTVATLAATNCTDTSVVNGSTYYYVVSALGMGGESSNSGEAGATPYEPAAYWINTVTSSAQSWNANANWSGFGTYPNAAAMPVVINANIPANQTINLNQVITLGALTVGDPDASAAYTIAANGGSLVFNNNTNAALLAGLPSGKGDTITAPVTLDSNLTISNSSANLLTLSGNLASTGKGVALVGGGPVLLSGSNTYSGGTLIRNGRLRVASSNSLGAASAGAVITNTGTFDVNGANLAARPFTVSGAGAGGGGAIINSGASQINAFKNITLAGDTTFGGTGRWDLRGGSASLLTGGRPWSIVKIGPNQVSLVSVNPIDSALADIDVREGMFAVQNSTAQVGDPNRTITVRGGATLNFWNLNPTPLNKKIVLEDGATVFNESGVSLVAGPVTLQGSDAFNIGGTSLAISNTVGGPGSLIKNGSGTLTLSKPATYAGLTAVNNGTLSAGTTNCLPAGSALTVALEGSSTGRVDLAGFKLSVGSLAGSGFITNSSGAGVVLTVGSDNTSTFFDGVIGVSNSLVKVGGGVLRFSGDNTYNGGTTVSNGTLLVNNATGSGTGSGAVGVMNGGSLGGEGTIAGPVTIGSGGTLAPGDGPGTLTLSADLSLANSAALNFELGEPADRVMVGGNLTLGGVLNVTDISGFFAEGVYPLFNYAGVLTDRRLVIGFLPSGFTGAVDTSTPGQVSLVVSRLDPLLVGFDAWRRQYFTAAELADPAVSGPAAAPAGDRMANFLKYALGLAPKVPGTTGITLHRDGDNWVLSFQRPAERPDVLYRVEVSTDLASWSSDGVALQRTTINGDRETWEGSHAGSDTRYLFFRLAVQQL